MTSHPNRRYCFGLPYLLETNSIQEAIDLAVRLGLDFVELNNNFPQCELGLLDPVYLNSEAKRQGIFYTLHLDDAINIADFNPLVREAYVQTVLEAIRIALETAMPVINIHLAKGNIVTLPDGKHYLNEAYREVYEGALRSFRNRCEAAIGDAKLLICVENTEAWADYEKRGIDILLESPVFGLTLDTGHDHATKNQDLAYIESRIDRLHHMHAHDGYDLVNHQAVGSGEIPLALRFCMAREAKATIVLETKTVEALEESVAWLHNHPEHLP